ncbi:hypothetical protein GCM10022406_36800 [Hymenobacter algoricola]|uniref:Uncharacterized protein n=1 Tax=Hymenobacter algoricola TaxID=486267 RepID=A0ABP7NRF6_9BACT
MLDAAARHGNGRNARPAGGQLSTRPDIVVRLIKQEFGGASRSPALRGAAQSRREERCREGQG